MQQLDFLSAIEPKRTEAGPLTKTELLAAGPKAQRMGAVDREEVFSQQSREWTKCLTQLRLKKRPRSEPRPLIGAGGRDLTPLTVSPVSQQFIQRLEGVG
ncbi:hypothetical protein [Mesorhizobium sp. LSJC264A00]|uniref:hypothetical protein n=1 Tax=unclassified Mesorhizobium TaxID=325217 RepID=UPI0003CF175D|nr:hypothetical protein [Mesorhizobium sp. LSJC264A00]ESX24166.1 hypothetical protein X767_13150 [Mesorhizobium sp. LSJC264A00]